ncbi:MAG: hypothetical protein R2867_01145 [Caldilineaceae bacterium]
MRRPILEFGLRRGHERGGNAGARAALIGGASFTSNVGVSRAMGLPPKGTHAHSMVQLFMAMGQGELAAFRAYAESIPTTVCYWWIPWTRCKVVYRMRSKSLRNSSAKAINRWASGSTRVTWHT